MATSLIHGIDGIDLEVADDLRARLVSDLRSEGTYRIETAGWMRCDLSGVAVLLSAAKTASALGATLEIDLPSDGLVETCMRGCGLDPALLRGAGAVASAQL
ncbi:STAS domain-containing protein [Rhodovulum kholense]|uniref:STAS domain-containing protein n=1 Tax=Rhodovulum kholense TaxID=453584 RepID=A0A8E2VKY3_9RHOB|nr:STAS domain-containing protein [Rhodovulum kholense]PTW49824.1 STAS domain-containing protein [Rhodovulum kholense]